MDNPSEVTKSLSRCFHRRPEEIFGSGSLHPSIGQRLQHDGGLCCQDAKLLLCLVAHLVFCILLHFCWEFEILKTWGKSKGQMKILKHLLKHLQLRCSTCAKQHRTWKRPSSMRCSLALQRMEVREPFNHQTSSDFISKALAGNS